MPVQMYIEVYQKALRVTFVELNWFQAIFNVVIRCNSMELTVLSNDSSQNPSPIHRSVGISESEANIAGAMPHQFSNMNSVQDWISSSGNV